MENRQLIEEKANRTSKILKFSYILFCLLGLGIIAKIIKIQWFYEPDPFIYAYFAPQDRKVDEKAIRGNILTKDGEILATSVPKFQISMDCTIKKKLFEGDKASEEEWRRKAAELSKGLASIFRDKTAGEYYAEIIRNREKGVGHMDIGKPVDYDTKSKVLALPLFREGRMYGGYKVSNVESRIYPYGSLALKTIGSEEKGEGASGLEYSFEEQLRGKDGTIWMKEVDQNERVPNNDRENSRAVDGNDIKTTLDLRLQEITDEELRKALGGMENTEGGCAIVMEVETGAIRAMVNLHKDDSGRLGETFNYAVRRKGNPGSVFKAATLMALLEDKKVELEDSIPTFYGKWSYNGESLPDDDYLYKSKWPDDKITISDGFMISSNHVFRYLACENYGHKPEKFIEKLRSFKLLDNFDFDIQGLAEPTIHDPADKNIWSNTSLPSIAMGYSVNITPLHTLMFYNAIANKGKMMKPYLVEDIEKNGKVKKEFKPQVIDRQICSKAVADTITRAMLKVTEGEKGTAREPFRKAKCRVAGKTGTARIEFEDKATGKMVFKDSYDQKKHQATFVGFFPVEKPVYTVIVVIYSKPTIANVYGVKCAPVVRAIADDYYCMSTEFSEVLKKKGSVPKMDVKED